MKHVRSTLPVLLTLTVFVGSACSSGTPGGVSPISSNHPGSGGAAPTASLLPGEELWGPNKVSSYIFGSNDSVNYSSPNVETDASVQNYIKQGHLTLLRELFQNNMSDADIKARINTLSATGMHCLALLDATGSPDFMKHVVRLTSAVCPMYEFGNEPDNGGPSVSVYLTEWNTDIPQLRALAPNARFGGAATLGASTYLHDFLAGTASSGNTPDFVSFHQYPCYGATSQDDCLKVRTTSAFDYDLKTVVGWERQIFGHRVPTGITEYNFDPGGANLGAWANDKAFMYKWTELALQRFMTDGYDFATQYTSLNYSGYGALDMFRDAAPFAPKPQFWAMVDMGEKNGSGSTLTVPSPCC